MPSTAPSQPSTSPAPGDGASLTLAREIATQPDNWVAARDLASRYAAVLPAPGERVAVLGCGTSLYVARAYAALREARGLGETDAWPGGDANLRRPYDRVLAITRSGTTTEILQALAGLDGRTPVTVITSDPTSPVVELGEVISLAHVDEESVVQTRTATTALALLRWSIGDDVAPAAAQAAELLAVDEAELVSDDLAAARAADQITFVGMGWGFAVAEEAALKLEESTQAWTESFHMTEYRHGPISIAAPGRAVWALGPPIPQLDRDVTATGADWIAHDRDPLAELVLVHRLCLVRAADRGLDAGAPRNVSRSIILES